MLIFQVLAQAAKPSNDGGSAKSEQSAQPELRISVDTMNSQSKKCLTGSGMTYEEMIDYVGRAKTRNAVNTAQEVIDTSCDLMRTYKNNLNKGDTVCHKDGNPITPEESKVLHDRINEAKRHLYCPDEPKKKQPDVVIDSRGDGEGIKMLPAWAQTLYLLWYVGRK